MSKWPKKQEKTRKGRCVINEQQQKLVEDNHDLIYFFLHKRNLDINEWYGIAALGLCKAAVSYEKEKAAFTTYAYRCMENEIKLEYRKQNRAKEIPQNNIISYDEEYTLDNGDTLVRRDIFPSNADTENDAILSVFLSDFQQRAKSYVKPLHLEILLLHANGYSAKEIAAKKNMSYQNVRAIIYRTREKIRKYFLKQNCM